MDNSSEESLKLRCRFSQFSSTVELKSAASGCDVNTLQQFCLQLSQLRQLDLKGLELQLARVEALAISLNSLQQLEVLIIDNTKLGDEALEVLSGPLKGHGKLRELQAAGNMIGPKGAVALAAALTPGPNSELRKSLTALNLSGNQIGWQGRMENDCVDGFSAIAGVMKHAPLLTLLNLSCNFMGARAGTVLALEGLACSPSLQTLILAGNGIGFDGAHSLAKALTPSRTNAFNTSLTTLDLAGNAIGPDGARVLAQALVFGEIGLGSCSLRALNLAGNFLSVEGAKAWAEALLPNSMGTFPLSLTTLDLSGNSLEAEGAMALSTALMAENSSGAINLHFCTLNVWGNGVTMEGAGTLIMAAKRRQPSMLLCGSMLDVLDLDLSNRFLAPYDLTLLANDLRTATSLKTLDLSGNNLCGINEYGIGSYDPRGIQALAEVLRQGAGPLHTLNLAGNALRQQEVRMLVMSISMGEHTRLKVLDVGELDHVEEVKSIAPKNLDLRVVQRSFGGSTSSPTSAGADSPVSLGVYQSSDNFFPRKCGAPEGGSRRRKALDGRR